jgi:precorrin-4 methylase
VKAYQQAGKSDLPIAIIQNGTTQEERFIAGTIQDIEAKALQSRHRRSCHYYRGRGGEGKLSVEGNL